MKRAKWIAAISLAHTIVFSLSLFFAISEGMKGFDTGVQAPTWIMFIKWVSMSQFMPTLWFIGHIGKPVAKYFPGIESAHDNR